MSVYRINRGNDESPLQDAKYVTDINDNDIGFLVEVEPTDRIRWCFAHSEELGQRLTMCDTHWKRNERSLRIGAALRQTCDIGDALLVRVPKEDTDG